MSKRMVIVGAGPAGTRCAEKLVAEGYSPTVVDEGNRNGGQIYRRQPDNFTRSYETLYGTEASRALAVHKTFDRLRDDLDYRPNTLVWNIDDTHVYVVTDGVQSMIPYDILFLCTGATDRLMPINGWNLAGTFTLGGAQVALKSQACSVGRKVVFVGTGPLLYLVSAQYVKAGARVAAVLDTSPFMARVPALPKLLTQPRALLNGLKLIGTLLRARVKMKTGVTPVQIKGAKDSGVSGFSYKDKSGSTHDIECDAVAVGYHLRPETQLADLARCDFYFCKITRQWLPRTDALGRSSKQNIYLAGDGASIVGADAAELSGRLIALAALQDNTEDESRDQAGEISQLVKKHEKLVRFSKGLAQAFPWPSRLAAELSENTVVCRCEAVTVGELHDVVNQKATSETNRAKAFSRVGMGRCQGRYCSNSAAEIISAVANVDLEKVGRLRGQAPVKPISIGVIEEDK